VTIHDASFLRFPDTLEPKNLAYLRSQLPRTLARADRVLTVSKTMAKDLQELCGLSADRVRATPLGPPPLLETADGADDAARLRELGLDRPYLLHVGTLEPRKNHRFLFDLFAELEDFDGDLVLCGMEGWRVEPILEAMNACPRSGRIRRLRFVSDAQLGALYRHAEALLFPSLYEGFGLPPVEAMRQGCPVLASDGGSLPEIVGAGGRVLPLELEAWRAAVTTLLEHPSERKALREAGRARAADFSWESCAKDTWAAYRELAP
jgi:glycosyltransferase involved in cell wall biosynthesis